MRYKSIVLAGVLALAASGQTLAGDAETCKAVRFSDVGWTDIQVETALAGQIMNALGYESEIQVLSVPVTYQGLGNGDLDIFLGNWMPSMTADVQPYLDAGTVEQLNVNLENAGYGLVVPSYVAEAGVTDLSHLSANADKFESKIYGIEPGNDGNRIVLGMIDDPANNLAGWELVESSEAGMLGEAQAKIAAGEWVVFLGWTPHPVMGKMGLTYLTGMGDTGFGGATVYTNVRAGYATECPNVAKFLTNYTFNLEMVGVMMDEILTNGKDAETAASDWIKANPGALDAWLAGVTTYDGGDGLAAVKAAFGL